MSQILDETYTAKARMYKCKRLRNIVLLFSGFMVCITLTFRLMHYPYQEYFLIAGMLAITFQSHYCFHKRSVKTWIGLTRVILITLITSIVICYVLLPSVRLWFQ